MRLDQCPRSFKWLSYSGPLDRSEATLFNASPMISWRLTTARQDSGLASNLLAAFPGARLEVSSHIPRRIS
eukprot:SAG31_NODE_25949_length_451_cov_0.732955_1_plen_70_part_10